MTSHSPHFRQAMVGKIQPMVRYYLLLTWSLTTPLMLLFVSVLGAVHQGTPRIGSYMFPVGAQLIGWAFTVSPFAIALGFAVKTVRFYALIIVS